MAKNLNVRKDDNVHGSKNPHYKAGDEHVEASHLDVLFTLPFMATLLGMACERLKKSGAEVPVTADEVFRECKRQCRTLIFEGVKASKTSQGNIALAMSALCGLGFSTPKPSKAEKTESRGSKEIDTPKIETTTITDSKVIS